ncbi:hypothetical protein Patl1_34937 [Pistacia atlantica]|uniref:Uncharacterized protein n=1 Tax=Pistacia atlantica TaxID=434234 RepID=A0ACC0ZR84_9ROSI|nr:hypothetical protein Patl1_34937 [Pistacia atlantica]
MCPTHSPHASDTLTPITLPIKKIPVVLPSSDKPLLSWQKPAPATNNKNGSPLVNLAQDHLFSILLRLPIESILSFAMSCKRFRSLTSSDFLWESLCKRDWGESSVNALKSSCQIVPWMWLYKQGSQLECVSCHKLSDPDVDLALPNPRASHSLNFVSNCLVLFGGGCEGAPRFDFQIGFLISESYGRDLSESYGRDLKG